MSLGLANQYMVHMESPGFNREEEVNCLNVMVSHLLPETWNHIPDFHTDHRAYTCVRGEIDRYRLYLDVFMPALESLNMK